LFKPIILGAGACTSSPGRRSMDEASVLLVPRGLWLFTREPTGSILLLARSSLV
jgi:hypothetical protein